MDAYENMVRIISGYSTKNHYKSLILQKKVNEHISGLRMLAKDFHGMSVGTISSREATRYEKLLILALKGK